MEDLLADTNISRKNFFSEYGLPNKIIAGAGDNFISDKFKTFFKKPNIELAVSSSYHHQINRLVEMCIKFIKQTMKKCIHSNF